MSLLEIISLYSRAFIDTFFYQSSLSPVFKTLLDTSENQVKLSQWQQTIGRVAELTARKFSVELLHADKDTLFNAVIALAQADANDLLDKLARQPEVLMVQVPTIESVLKQLQDERQKQWQSADASNRTIYRASREDIKAYLASISTHNANQSFYQFVKAKHPSVEIIACSVDLAELDLSGGQFQSCDFSGAKIRLAKQADFRYCLLIEADLQKADITGSDFQGANLSLANAQGAQFKQVNLTDASLIGTNLSQAYLEISRDEQVQWVGANLTDIYTESLIIAEQLQQKQQEQTQQSVQQFKRQQQWWQALLPVIPTLITAITEMNSLIPSEQRQEVSIFLSTLNQIHLLYGLLRQHVKMLKHANTVLNIESLKETLSRAQQHLKAVRAEANWQNLLFSWQEITKLSMAAETQATGLEKLAKLVVQSQEQLKAIQQTLLSTHQLLTSQQKNLQEVAIKQWQAMRVRMAFDQALKQIDETISMPYRQVHRVNDEEKPLSCFISYSWGDPVNERKVHRIAADLRQAGIGMLLDIWDNKPGTSVSRFTHETRNCDVVLLTGTLKLMEKWRIKMGVVSQEIPQIYGRLDQTPIRRVIGLHMNGETLADVLPQEFLERKVKLKQNDFIDLRQTPEYEKGIFQILRELYQVQPNTKEALAIDIAEQLFLQTVRTIEQMPLIAQLHALGYEGDNVEAQLTLSLQAIARYEAEKQAQKRALENLLPITLNKVYQAYETRQKQAASQPAIGMVSGQLALAQPLPHVISETLHTSDISPVLLIKTQPETAASVHLLEKTLWRNYQSDPERQPIPVVIDVKKVLTEVNGQLPDNYDTVMHVLRQQLHYSDDEIQRLKSDYRLVFVFTHYEALNALSYAPYIDNHLEQWPQAKAIVLCDKHFLANKNYQTVLSAGKQAAHLKLWEGEAMVWMAEHEQAWQVHLKSQPIARSARELHSDQTELLRDFVVQEYFVKALKTIQKHLGNKSPSLYVSYAPGEPEFTWQLMERLLIDLPQAGFKVLMDVRSSLPVQEDNNNVATQIPSSRYLSEMDHSDFILVTGSRWYLKQYEEKAPAIQEELDQVVHIEASRKNQSQSSKNFTSPIMPLLLERPADPKARLETVLPPLTALRDSVCIDFKRPDQGYFDVLFDQLIPALYQASVYHERQNVIQEAYQQFQQAYQEAQILDAEGLLQKVGYKQPTLSQAEQYLARQTVLQGQNKAQLLQLVPARLQPLFQAHQQRVQQPELSQALAYYVPLDGQLQSTSEERFELGHYLASFLDPKNASQVLLLQGESGSGKSLSIHRLEQQLWQAYREHPQQAPMPILLELKAIEADVPLNFVEHYLQQRLGYTPEALKTLKTTQPVIFLFDGYDELPGQARSVFTDNTLETWLQAKVIVTARPSVVQRLENYKQYFKNHVNQFAQECYVSAFSQKQIDTYLKHYSQDNRNQRLGWDLARYQTTLASMPSLQGIMASPLLLRMVVEVLPELAAQRTSGTNNNGRVKPVTRADVYRLFIQRWFTREDIRLLELGNRPADFDAQAAFGAFAEQLAFHMFLKGLVEVHFDEALEANNSSPEWVEYFRTDDPLVAQKRAGCPLKQVESRYSFYHKSFLEYFAATYVYRNAYLGGSPTQFEQKFNELKNWPLNQTLMTEDTTGTGDAMLNFLAELCGHDEVKQERLLQVVKRSREDREVKVAAANGLTIRTRASVSSSSLQLAGIDVSGADLSYGIFDHTDFSAANLTGANLQNAWLRKANLNGANLSGVKFGERPHLPHERMVRSVAYSQDGRWLATTSGNDIIIWDTASSERYQVLKGHTADVISIAISADGKLLASGSFDKTCKLWDIESGEVLKTLEGHSNYVLNVAISASGKLLASGSQDKTCKLWDIETGKELKTLAGHSNFVYSVTFSADSKLLATGSDDTTCKLWDIEHGKELKTLAGHTKGVKSIVFSANGKLLATGSGDNTCKLWDIEHGKVLKTLAGHSNFVNSIALSSSGKLLASASSDNSCKLWDIESGKELKTLTGHGGSVYSVAFSADGKLLATGSGDNTCKLWDIARGEELKTLAGHSIGVSSVAISMDGKVLASGSNDKTCKLWDVESGEVLKTLAGHSDLVCSVAISMDGKVLVTGSADKTCKLWDIERGEVLKTFEGHSKSVKSVALSADGKMLATGSEDKTCKLWDIESGKELKTLVGHNSFVFSVAFSADGKLLASGESGDKICKLWDINSGKELKTLAGHIGPVFCVAFSPDGKLLATVSGDTTCKLWDIENGKELKILAGHSRYVFSVAFSADGKLLATGSYDNTCKLWEVESGKLLATLSGYLSYVTSVAWHQDRLITGSSDKSVKCWKVQRKADGSLDCTLLWSSHVSLNAENCQLEQSLLSPINSRLLKQKGAHGYPLITAHDYPEWNKLHLAAANNNGEALKQLLLEQPALLDSQTPQGETALHIAARYEAVEAIEYLLRQGSNVFLRNTRGQCPGNLAVDLGLKAVLAYLPCEDKMHAENTPLHLAAEQGQTQAVAYLCNLQVPKHFKDYINVPNHQGQTPLMLAAARNNTQVVTALLEQGANLHQKNQSGETAAHIAVLKHQLEVLELLKTQGADLSAKDIKGNTLLHSAISVSGLKSTKWLLEQGVAIDVPNEAQLTPLALALVAKYYRKEITEMLLEKDTNLKALTELKTEEKENLLLWAAKEGHLKSLQALLNIKVNLEAKNDAGETAAYIAAANNQVEALKLLKAHGADLLAKNKSSGTPLHGAAGSNRIEAVKWLLEQAIPIDILDNNGNTPLHWAAYNGHKATVELLLQKGANALTLNKSNQTPAQLASSNKKEDMAAYIKECIQKKVQTEIQSLSQSPYSFVANMGANSNSNNPAIQSQPTEGAILQQQVNQPASSSQGTASNIKPSSGPG